MIKTLIEPLDGRHKGHEHWTHRILITRDWTNYAGASTARKETFLFYKNLREELWREFGPGCDREDLYKVLRYDPESRPNWGWWVDSKNGDSYYIYFRNGPIMTWFSLRY